MNDHNTVTNRHSINYLRWQQFKQNRRGYVSLWIFGLCFILSLLADVLMNDKPIFIKYQDNYYVPIISQYPETTFGGTICYRNQLS